MKPAQRRYVFRHRFAVGASIAIAAIFVVVSLAGLLVPAIYARETSAWAAQATAQDWFDLLIAAPALIAASLLTARASRSADLVLGGCLLYAAYTFATYAFAVHLNALFLLYCAGLGLALYGLISLARAIHTSRRVDAVTRQRMPAVFLILLGAMFAALWLRQLIPAAFTGHEPAALAETGLPTNPIHVLDLSFILPLHVLAGMALWRRSSLGAVLAPVVLAFDVLMSASIAVLAGTSSGMAVAAVMAIVSTSAAVCLARLR